VTTFKNNLSEDKTRDIQSMTVCKIRYALVSDIPAPDHHLNFLDGPEIERRNRYVKKEDQLRFTLGRMLSKTLTAEQLDIHVSEVSIGMRCKQCGSKDHGKPFALHLGQEYPISISHSDDIVIVAITDGPQTICLILLHLNTKKRYTISTNRIFIDSGLTKKPYSNVPVMG